VYQNYSDKELWNLVRVNDRRAFEAIYRKHWSQLMISAYNVLEDREVCRDILQDVFTDLWVRRRTTFIDSLPSYLKVAVRNKVFKQLRKGYLSRKHLDSLEKISFSNATEDLVNFNQMKESYEKSLAELPEKCKEIFLLRRVEQLSVKEIAEKLFISPKTVENQITKAQKLLRSKMDGVLLVFIMMYLI